MKYYVVLRITVVLVCALAIRWSYVLIRADQLFREDTPQSIRHAIDLTPDQARYYIRLAHVDDTNAAALIETALKLAPFSPAAAIELGLRSESAGDYLRAEKLLLHAFDVDRTYVPRWTLANFYFRRNKIPEFRAWARRAAEMPADDIGGLFELCWRDTPDGERLARDLLTGDPSTARQLLAFLLAKKESRSAVGVAQKLIDTGDPGIDRTLLLSLVDRLVSENEPVSATAIWSILQDRQWIVADRDVSNNPNFARLPLAVAFDWRFPAVDGLNTTTGPSGLEVEFSGKQPEICLIAEQVAPLSAGQYEFVFTYRTGGVVPETGIAWTLSDVGSKETLSRSPVVSSESFTEQRIRFSVGALQSLVRLKLEYRRALGTPRISGRLDVRSAFLRTFTDPDLSKLQ